MVLLYFVGENSDINRKSQYADQHKLALIEPAVQYISVHYIADLFSVSKITELLGYESIYYFSQTFKNVFVISPQRYMQRCKSSE